MTSPTWSASSAGSSSVSADVAAGKLPDDMPPQLEIEASPTNWDDYDVPRIWSSIKDEDRQDAWLQAAGFENLSVLLADHHDRLAVLRETLVQSWDPAVSRAASAFLQGVDMLIRAMRDDAYAHASTARGLNGVLEALKVTKSQVAIAKARWDSVTTDLSPEWWDHAADKLNDKARSAMVEMDGSVSDHRKKILVPEAVIFQRYSEPDVVVQPGAGAGTGNVDDSGTGSDRNKRPRTSSAYPEGNPRPSPVGEPVESQPTVPPLSGGLGPAVPTIGSPPSSLPIPPGNPYVPTGGAYVLPGATTGQGGGILPMPLPTAMKNEIAAARAIAAREASARGITPVPIAGGMGAAGRGGDARLPKREGDIQWEILQGVPPVIGEPSLEEQSSEQEAKRVASLNDVFEEWYASLLTPWDKQAANAETANEEKR